MTKHELDQKLLENDYRPDLYYTIENIGIGDNFVIKKERKFFKKVYNIYYNERGVLRFETETKSLEEAFDFLWSDYETYELIPLNNLKREKEKESNN